MKDASKSRANVGHEHEARVSSRDFGGRGPSKHLRLVKKARNRAAKRAEARYQFSVES